MMNKKAELKWLLGLATGIIAVIVIITVGLVVSAKIGATNYASYNSSFLSDGTDNVDAGVEIISSSATNYNRTWLSFDGVNDYMSYPYQSALKLNSTGTTISLWVKFGSLPTTTHNIAGTFPEYNNGWMFNQNNRTLYLYWLSGGAKITVPNALGTNTWTYLTLVKNNTGLTFYLNGALNSTGDLGTNAEGSNNITLGGRPTGTWMINGSIDEVRIYNRSLTSAEVSTLYGYGRVQNYTNTNGLIIYLPVNEGTSDKVYNLGSLGGYFE